MSAAPRRKPDAEYVLGRPRLARTTPRTRARGRARSRGLGLVLIADDTPDIRELYDLYLTHRGFTVQTVIDGEAAIQKAVWSRPDVVVMDLSMPRLDGIGAIQRLKRDARTRQIPVIIFTGYPYKAIEQGALEAGADAFLTKPCLPEDLEQHIQRLIDRSRASHP